MTFKFEFVPVNTLPKLAWCARVCKNSDTVTVFHGDQVETGPDFFAEGAWNGDFSGFGLGRADIVCGTGGRLQEDKVWLSSSTDALAPLFSIQKPDAIHVSNSPIFVLAITGEQLDPLHPYYSYDLVRIFRQGLRGVNNTLHTATGAALGVHFCTQLAISTGLRVDFQAHPVGEKPEDYRHYRDLLQRGVNDVVNNSRHLARQCHYQPLALVSRGYDSNATATLAVGAGCQHAATFVDSRKAHPAEDSGLEIAHRLGMACREYERWAYLQRPDPIDIEFALTTTPANPSLGELEHELAGRLLIGGNSGECAWTLRRISLVDDLQRSWTNVITGVNPVEFRLRVGYLPFAPPMIGLRHNRALKAIMESPEMRPWWLGNEYDRALPRRIVEEAGIPRTAFGMKKIGGLHANFANPHDLSPKALASYEAFVHKLHAPWPTYRLAYGKGLTLAEQGLWNALYGGRRRRELCLKLPWHPVFLNGERESVPWRFGFMLQWAVDGLRTRYALPDPP